MRISCVKWCLQFWSYRVIMYMTPGGLVLVRFALIREGQSCMKLGRLNMQAS